MGSPSAARLGFSTGDIARRVRVVNVAEVFVLITLLVGRGCGSEILMDGVAFGALGGTGVEIDGAILI